MTTDGPVSTDAARRPIALPVGVVVVTHGGVIGEVLANATGARGFAFIGADNASISHIVVEEDRVTVRRFNDTTHLDPHFSVAAPPPI